MQRPWLVKPNMTSAAPSLKAAVLGFVGSPWTLATYIIEGKSSALYKTIKTMLYKVGVFDNCTMQQFLWQADPINVAQL